MNVIQSVSHSLIIFSLFLCLSLSLYLSLTRTHTHTHTPSPTHHHAHAHLYTPLHTSSLNHYSNIYKLTYNIIHAYI
jgi:hypothetical protein